MPGTSECPGRLAGHPARFAPSVGRRHPSARELGPPRRSQLTTTVRPPRGRSDRRAGPVPGAGMQADRLGGQRVAARGVRARGRRQVAGLALGLAGPDQGAAAGQQAQRDQGQYGPGHERDDPSSRPSRGRRGRRTGRGRRGRAVFIRARPGRRGPVGRRSRARAGTGGWDAEPAAWLRAAHVEPERRVPVGHQAGVSGHPEHPAVQAEHEVEQRLRVPAGDGQDDRGHQRPGCRSGRRRPR